ncbi:hypothetical protein [Nitrosococcus halophilus]|nr:hypothetical protein [Nitrosococcus halophilus]
MYHTELDDHQFRRLATVLNRLNRHVEIRIEPVSNPEAFPIEAE